MSITTPSNPELPELELGPVLGEGATGRVYRARLKEALGEQAAGSEVALKVLHPHVAHSPAARRAFAFEARAGSVTRHPNLVRVLWAGEGPDGPSILFEFVPGRSLREVLSRGPLPEPQVRNIGRQLAAALVALHAAGYRHGDLKPENVRLDDEGHSVLLDLGFSQPLEPPVVSHSGSSLYLSPEIARGRAAGSASDIFALGIALYELATGLHPFAVTTPGDTSSRAGGRSSATAPAQHNWTAADLGPDAFVDPSRRAPHITPFLDRLLRQMLSVEPDARPPAAEVECCLEQGERSAWWLKQLEATRAGAAAPFWSHLTPLVGRDEELEKLRTLHIRSASSGACALLSGQPGSGKSRLVDEFVRELRSGDDPPLFLFARCPRPDDSRPGRALLGLLARWLILPHGLAPGPREVEQLATLVPPSTASTLQSALDPESRDSEGESVLAALATWLNALGHSRPTVAFLDDFHRADGATLLVLEQISRDGTLPLFLILGQRADITPDNQQRREKLLSDWSERGMLAEIALGPLKAEDVARLVDSSFDVHSPRESIARTLFQRSAGGPGQLLDILRRMEHRGDLIRDDAPPHRLRLSIAPSDIPYPASEAREMARSYASLGREDELWLRQVAVVGEPLVTEFLLNAFPASTRGECDDRLASLVRTGWLQSHGAHYRFTGGGRRKFVLASMKSEARRLMHADVAAALEERSGFSPNLSDESRRAYHLREAGAHAELIEIVPGLLRILRSRGHLLRTLKIAGWGLEAIEAEGKSERDPLHVAFLEAAVDAADRLGRENLARTLLGRLAALEFDPEDGDEMETAGRVLLLHGRFAAHRGQYSRARSLLTRALEVLRRAGAETWISESARLLASVLAHQGELRAAGTLAREAEKHAVNEQMVGEAKVARAVVDLLAGDLESALEHLAKAVLALRQAADRVAVTGALGKAQLVRARVYRAAGRPARALAAAQGALRLARRSGERHLEAEARARLGVLYLDVDQPVHAEEHLIEARFMAEEIGDRRARALAGLFLGVLMAEEGRISESRPRIRQTVELAHESGLNRIEALASAVRARLLRSIGEPEAAMQHSSHAMQLLEQFGADGADRVVIAGTHAMLLREAGKLSRADNLERRLRRSLRRQNRRFASQLMRRRHSLGSRRLLDAVLSPDGPLFPRVQLREE